MRSPWLVLLPALIFGCSGDEEQIAISGVALRVQYDSNMVLGALSVTATGESGDTVYERVIDAPLFLDPPGRRSVPIEVSLDDAVAAQTIRFAIEGLDQGMQPVGSGSGQVTGMAGTLVELVVELGLLECQGDVCARCGDGIRQATEGCDDGNTIDGDGCDTRCNVEGVPLPQPVRFGPTNDLLRTDSPEFSALPGVVLDIPAADVDWLFIASGTLSSESIEEIAAEARIVIDGAESEVFGHQNRTPDSEAGFMTFDVIPGNAVEHSVSVELRGVGGGAWLSQFRMMALPIPPTADVRFVRADAGQTARGDDVELLSLVAENDGDRVVMAKGNFSEEPGDNTAQLWLETGSGPRPLTEDGGRFSNGRAPWAPMMVSFIQPGDLDIDGTVSLHGSSSAQGLPGDWWDPGYRYRQTLEISTNVDLQAGYVTSVEFDHASVLGAGQSLMDGRDVRIVVNGQEVPTALDQDSQFGQPDTRLWFTIPVGLGGGEILEAFIYFGNFAAGQVNRDPGNVFLFYDDFSAGLIDEEQWTINVGNPRVEQGVAVLEAATRMTATAIAESDQMMIEARAAVTDGIGGTVTVFGGTGPNLGAPQYGFRVNEQAGFEIFADLLATPINEDPLTPHEYQIRVVNGAARFFIDGNNVGEQPSAILQSAPVFRNATETRTIFVDWVRIRPAGPDPQITVAGIDDLEVVASSTWQNLRILSFRTDAFPSVYYEEERLNTQLTDEVEFVPILESVIEEPGEYFVLQAIRVSGPSTETDAKSGEVRVDGDPLISTRHVINRDSTPENGYHHVAGVADIFTVTSSAVRFQTGGGTPGGGTVDLAEAVIIGLGIPQ